MEIKAKISIKAPGGDWIEFDETQIIELKLFNDKHIVTVNYETGLTFKDR